MNFKKRIVFILGPTASGKTKISLELSRRYHAEIISADSMQVYRGMDIGTDKISLSDRMDIRHHLIDIMEPYEEFSVFDFRRKALCCIDDIHKRGNLPLVVGGSGLYIKALIHGLAPYPSQSKKIREELKLRIKNEGLLSLYKHLNEIDPRTAKDIHPNDQRRIIRSIEIYQQMHIPPSLLAHERKSLESLGYEYILIGLCRDRKNLYARVNERVDEMIARGFIDEVKGLRGRLSLTTSQAVGYKEIAAYIDGEMPLKDAVDEIKKKSRNLVKKQLTWFRKDKRITWVELAKDESIINAVNKISSLLELWLEG